MSKEIEKILLEMGLNARKSSQSLALASTQQKNESKIEEQLGYTNPKHQ